MEQRNSSISTVALFGVCFANLNHSSQFILWSDHKNSYELTKIIIRHLEISAAIFFIAC